MNRRLAGVAIGVGMAVSGPALVFYASSASAWDHCGTPQAEADCPASTTTLPVEAHPSIPAVTTTAPKPTTTVKPTTTAPKPTTTAPKPPTTVAVVIPPTLPPTTMPEVPAPTIPPLPEVPTAPPSSSEVRDVAITPATTVYLAPPLTLVHVDRPSVVPVTEQPTTGAETWKALGLALFALGLGLVAYNLRPPRQVVA